MTPAESAAVAVPPRGSLPSITTLARETIELEGVARLHTTAEVHLGDSFDNLSLIPPDEKDLFVRREMSEPVHIHRVSDVALDASLMALYHGALPIQETLSHTSDDDYAYALIKPRPLEPTDDGAHHIIACNRPFRNYYHWMIQALPAIDWGLRRRGTDRVVLALPPISALQERTLALLGYAAVPRLVLDQTSHYRLASAEYAEFLGARMAGIASMAAAATFARLRDAVPPGSPGPAAIYVARTDSDRRIMANEAALIALLQARGINCVIPGQFSLDEQIALFRDVRLVIGAHGAGLSNLAFCRPQTHVYELVPARYRNFCMNRIAQAGGLIYWGDIFRAEDGISGDPRNNPHPWRWCVDLQVIASRLDEIQARMAGVPPPSSGTRVAVGPAPAAQPSPATAPGPTPTPTPMPTTMPGATSTPAASPLPTPQAGPPPPLAAGPAPTSASAMAFLREHAVAPPDRRSPAAGTSAEPPPRRTRPGLLSRLLRRGRPD